MILRKTTVVMIAVAAWVSWSPAWAAAAPAELCAGTPAGGFAVDAADSVSVYVDDAKKRTCAFLTTANHTRHPMSVRIANCGTRSVRLEDCRFVSRATVSAESGGLAGPVVVGASGSCVYVEGTAVTGGIRATAWRIGWCG